MSIVDRLLEAEGDIVLGFRRPDLSDLLREAASEYETLAAVNAELLEALVDIIESVAQCTDDDGRPTYEVCQTDDFSSARAAIAKAKGDDHA